MEGRTDVETPPQVLRAPRSESAVDAPAIRNAQSKLQSAIEKMPFEDFERIPSTNYQELARTFVHAEPGQVAQKPLRAAFLIWGAYAIEALLHHKEPKDEEFKALATMSSLYAATE